MSQTSNQPPKLSELSDEEDAASMFCETDRFKTWRKHTRDMYSTMVSYERTWESRSLQFFPTYKVVENGLGEQSVLMGTYTGGDEQNYVEINSLTLPIGNHQLSAVSYDAETGEVGGHGLAPNGIGCRTTLRMYHDGDVIQARYMPTNMNIISTVSSNGNLYLFDCTQIARSMAPNYGGRGRRLLPTAEYPFVDSDEKDPKKREQQKDKVDHFNDCVQLQEAFDRNRAPGQHKLCFDHKTLKGYIVVETDGEDDDVPEKAKSADPEGGGADGEKASTVETGSRNGEQNSEGSPARSAGETAASTGAASTMGQTATATYTFLSSGSRKSGSTLKEVRRPMMNRAGDDSMGVVKSRKFTTMDWCPTTYGRLAAGTYGGEISVWAVAVMPGAKTGLYDRKDVVNPFPQEATFTCTGGVINDLKFHPRDTFLIGGAVESYQADTDQPAAGLVLCDIRTSSQHHGGVVGQGSVKKMHVPHCRKGCRSLDWCPSNSFLLAMGTHRGTVTMFDIRNTTRPLSEVQCHSQESEVLARWSPHAAGVVATSGDMDCLSTIVDFSADEGDQVVFKHSEHGSAVNEVAWSPFKEYAGLLGSIDSNLASFWRPRDEYWGPGQQTEAAYERAMEKKKQEQQREADEIAFLMGEN